MNVAPGSDQATKPPGSVSRPQPTGRWTKRSEHQRAYEPTSSPQQPHGSRDMKMIDAWAVHEAVMRYACRADLTTREWRVLSAVLSRTLRWQKVRDRVARSLLVEKSGVGKGSIGATIQSLCDLGFLTYEPGRGRALSSVGVIVPEHWERWRGGREVPDSETSDVPESETPEASEPETTEVPASETSGVSKSGTAEVAEHETLTGGFDGRTSTGDRYGGGDTGLVVLLPRDAEADVPHPPAPPDAPAVVQAFCEVVSARGVPWTEPKSPSTSRGRGAEAPRPTVRPRRLGDVGGRGNVHPSTGAGVGAQGDPSRPRPRAPQQRYGARG